MKRRIENAGKGWFCKALRLILVICPLFILPGCPDSKQGPAGGGKSRGEPAPVILATSSRKDMPVEVEAVGSVEPFASVGIKSLVTGILKKVTFKEGDPVKEGDLLFTIDERPFIASLNQARAALAKDRAALDNARKQAVRYLPAAEKGYVSQEKSDQAQTSVATLEATVKADEAAVEGARLDLDNCSIRSPIAGFTGALLQDRGNLITAESDQPLVTINQVTPIKVSFTLPEKILPELKKYLGSGSLKVQATPAGHSDSPLAGRISFLDNTVDATTGTIRLKATFPNPDQALWPGQFVHVTLQLTTRKDAIVIPAKAVQTSQEGNFVYVVKKDQTVELRPVTVASGINGESVIEAGLTVDETVVTDGQLRLAPGMKVKAVETNGNAGSPHTEAGQ